MSKPHKWAEVIKAWADGKTVQCRWTPNAHWVDYPQEPKDNWVRVGDSRLQWQIKPELKDPGIVCRDAFYKSIYPMHEAHSREAPEWTAAAKAVIEAYKAGELKDF